MDKAQVESKFKALVAEHLNIEAKAVIGSAQFADLGADSLDMVGLLMTVEEAFYIELPDDEVAKMLTVQQTIDGIYKAVGGR